MTAEHTPTPYRLEGSNATAGLARDISLLSAGIADGMQPYVDAQRTRVERGGE